MKSEIAVIGAGPAGIAVALQLKRYHIPCLLFEKSRPGGLLKNAHRVENYLGFPSGVTGPRLAALLAQQLDAAGVPVIFETVKQLTYKESENAFLIATSRATYRVSIVVSAGGTAPRTLDIIESLPPVLRQRVFYEVFPIADVREQRVLIIGAGDAAFDYALNLSAANDVIIANRGEQVKALPLLLEQVKADPRIAYYENAELREINGGNERFLRVTLSGFPEPLEIDYLLAAVGREPETSFYTSRLKKMKEELMRQNRLFEIGDVVNGIYRQTAIAAGDGIKAAMRIHQGAFLKNRPLDPRKTFA